MEIKIKRIYEKFSEDDGFRILVDRLWSRGIKKEEAKIDLWEEFKKRYEEEIYRNEENLRKLVDIIKNKKVVTLVFSAKDKEHNNAVVLRETLLKYL
jgi:uncharacterized protein YeaO (DUF488 family)